MRIFQTFLLPDELVAKYNMSFAGCNFSRNLMQGAGFDKVYSLLPWTISGELSKDAYTEDYEVIYSSLRNFKGVLSRLATFWEQWKIFKKIRNNDSVWFYNIYFLKGFLFLLLKIFKPHVKLNVIVLDFTPVKSIKQQNYWCRMLINKADGLILLADSPFFSCKNRMVLPGVVPEDDLKHPLIVNANKEFLLSGMISNVIAMVPFVLKTFAEMPECILHITGKVLDHEQMIREYAEKYDNIIYHGVISYNEYKALLAKVTFVLSSRNPNSPENKYNFPSKIIEALLHNRIVVSTMAYPQLSGIQYLNVSTDNFIQVVSDAVNNLGACVEKYANQGCLMKRKFGAKQWDKVMTLIENNSNNDD